MKKTKDPKKKRRDMNIHKELLDKVLETKDVKLAVFGQGHVGLPLSLAFASAGIRVIGVEKSYELVKDLNEGRCNNSNNLIEKLRQALIADKYSVTTDVKNACKEADIGIVCVPTPVLNGKSDLSYVIEAINAFCQKFDKWKVLIIESSLEPGQIENNIIPFMDGRGIKVGIDIGLAYCPERINPGDLQWHIDNIPRVAAVSDEATRNVVLELYKRIMSAPISFLSSFKSAEVVKSFENTFRFINISLVNELAIFCEKFGVDVYEVIASASTKPFAFMPHYPSAAIGGHCLPKDSLHLYRSSERAGAKMRILCSALKVNELMPQHIVSLIATTWNNLKLSRTENYVLLIGLSYKENSDDLRESPGLKVAEQLVREGFNVIISDPCIASSKLEKLGFPLLDNQDCQIKARIFGICIVQNHDSINKTVQKIVKKAPVRFLVDCKNMIENRELFSFLTSRNIKMVKLGSGKELGGNNNACKKTF
jgi:UDP-N-acetyl-D-glucosamine dehydrogenase